MSKPLVSIILPVYNAQNHIARCLESICAQSWQNIEVIVLNDGSKDQSLPVCEAFRAKDERIVLVDKANSGVSDTRNLGLKLAEADLLSAGELRMRSGARISIPRGREGAVRDAFQQWVQQQKYSLK